MHVVVNSCNLSSTDLKKTKKTLLLKEFIIETLYGIFCLKDTGWYFKCEYNLFPLFIDDH